jgi:hypothetical protein
LPIDPGAFRLARVHNQVHDRASVRTRSCRQLVRHLHIARCADSLRVNANVEDLTIGVLSKPNVLFLSLYLSESLVSNGPTQLAA